MKERLAPDTDAARLWQQAKQTLGSALALTPEERAAFLDEACGDDTLLRREVESLLAAHQHAGSFAERPGIHGFISRSDSQDGVGFEGEGERILKPGDVLGLAALFSLRT
jgi:hypothetical protein